MFGLSFAEVLIILALGLLLFGSHLPRLARSLGSSVASFRREVRNLEEDVRLPAS